MLIPIDGSPLRRRFRVADGVAVEPRSPVCLVDGELRPARSLSTAAAIAATLAGVAEAMHPDGTATVNVSTLTTYAVAVVPGTPPSGLLALDPGSRALRPAADPSEAVAIATPSARDAETVRTVTLAIAAV